MQKSGDARLCRTILHADVTDHPTALWLARQITEAFPWDSAPKVLVRDNDGAYGLAFRRRVCALGIQDRPITSYCPWQNGYVERLIGSIKRECVNHFIIFDARHLRRLLRAYARYYNHSRTHRGLGGQTPIPRSEKTVGRVVAIPVLGACITAMSATIQREVAGARADRDRL